MKAKDRVGIVFGLISIHIAIVTVESKNGYGWFFSISFLLAATILLLREKE